MYADLHMHSTYSDGTDTPLELCQLALQNNINVISITDHDSIEGVKSLLGEDLPKDVKIIPGVELSLMSQGKMIHILGYYIDLFDGRLEQFIDQISDDVSKNAKKLFERALNDKAFDYTWERVVLLNPGRARISGSSVIKAMRLDSYTPPRMSLDDMFYKYFFRKSDDLSLNEYDAVDVIKAVGGIPVIAHPAEMEDDEIVVKLIKHGAMGLEVFHPSNSKEDTIKYKQMAEACNLHITGGTDWHGNNNRFDTHFGMYGLDSDKYSILNVER